MQSLRPHTDFADVLRNERRFEQFTLVDIGCSGGVAPAWRQLGDKLCGVGIDANPAEVARLAAAETNQRLRYIAGRAGADPGSDYAIRKGGMPDLVDNPWPRLSVQRALDLRAAQTAGGPKPAAAYGALPAPPEHGIAPAEPPAPDHIVAPAKLRELGVNDVDFLKIDVDGKDYEILQSFAGEYDAFGILAIGVEVNFFGVDDDLNNTFHNIDRLMRREGFDLFDLSFWRYSLAALPGRFIWGAPAATDFGRILQGDALYARDIGNWRRADFAQSLNGEKLARLAFILAQFHLPDCAAEILLQRRAALADVIDVDHALDALARQAGAGTSGDGRYETHIANFEREAFGGSAPDAPPRRPARRIFGRQK